MSTVLQQEEKKEARLRVEDPRLLTGKGRFVEDRTVPNEAYMGLVLSPFAHAKIKSIDFTRARSSPHFIASLTSEDLVMAKVRPISQNPWPPQKKAKRYHLALGEVRFVGEPVAAVLSNSKSALEDILELVDVEYVQLPVVATIEESKQCKALVFDDWKDNVSQTSEEKHGDADKAIKSAANTITVREGIKRQDGAPIEPHVVSVTFDKSKGILEVFCTVQSVHGLQEQLSQELNVSKKKIHVTVADMGGGFGCKGGPSYPWPLLACLFALKTELPVKWTATRTEEFLASAAGRDEYCEVTLACDTDGKVVALKANIECDVGVSGTQSHMPSMTMWTMSGPYNIPNSDMKVTAYATNKMPIGPVRGAGAPEGCYFIERAMEIMAKKIGLDPIEFRRRNIERLSVPGAEDYQALLDALVKSSNYDALAKWKRDLFSKFMQKKSSLIGGIGISVSGSNESGDNEDWDEGESEWNTNDSEKQEWNKAGDTSWGNKSNDSEKKEWPKSSDTSRGDKSEEEELSFMTETAKVVLSKTGEVTVYTGSSPHGQGHETAFAQLASDELGIPFERTHVVWGDTQLIPQGVGTFGSRSAATGGSAVVDASRKLKNDLLERAASVLGTSAKPLAIRSGFVVNTADPTKLLASVGSVLEKLGLAEISADSKFTLKGMSYSSGVHLCAATLDVETGSVKIERYTVVEDCGRIINNPIVDGQLHGGVIHGIGGALLEELFYDSDGNLLNGNFMDYSIPTSTDCPNITLVHKTTPSTVTLNGAKGVGESGTIGSYAAVINALNDALSQVGKEVNIAPALPHTIYAAAHTKRAIKNLD